MDELPPGAQPPRRWHLHWELLVCGARGHDLTGTDAAELRPQDALLAREDPNGTRWHRCKRCDSWIALAPPRHPTRAHPPEREEIELPLRGKPLRDKIVLRVIAVDRALHFVVLTLLGLLVLVFSTDRATLRATFYKVLADLQGGVASEHSHASSGLWHTLNDAFTTSSSHLHLLGTVLLAYGAIEGIEAVGLWYQQRWAEYLTFLVTASLLPLDGYEILHHPTPFKLLALVVNVAIVIYLLLAKRLFGLRGGLAAEEAQAAHDRGWDALERTSPPAPVLD
ncbi:MAG TPA: DUF2127 domain-containing protein [Solirubrobacteraceae bacterium]|jgi:uncharacterized membrane protein (DUF2068 family)|nr:DUF2127 domain-containing protein [Solirubrobacteraceae bacterium]